MQEERYRNLSIEEIEDDKGVTIDKTDVENCQLVPLVATSLQKCQFNTLRFLLMISGLSSSSTAIPLATFLSLSAIMLFLSYVSRSFLDQQIDWTLLCHFIFAIHGSSVYSLLAYNLYHQLDIFSIIEHIHQPLNLFYCQQYENYFQTITKERRSLQLEYTSMITSSFVILAAIANFIAIWLEVGNPIAIVLGVQHTIPLKILSLFIWSFFCYGWFMPIAIVCPPTYFLLQQIVIFEKYIENHLSEHCLIDTLMHWYHELYDANVLLQKAFGSLVTITIVIGGVFQIILIMVSLRFFSFHLFR